ncbi:MAG TPA: hypothetical protein HA262_05440, partial [Methanosarcina sp.]|nr:hypothetical protein [Methanosarcina sp.]
GRLEKAGEPGKSGESERTGEFGKARELEELRESGKAKEFGKIKEFGKFEDLEKYRGYALLENYLIHRKLLEKIDMGLEKPGLVETYADVVKVFESFGLDRSLYYPVLDYLKYKVIWAGLSEESARVRKAGV